MVKNIDEALENFKKEVLKRKKALEFRTPFILRSIEASHVVNAMASVLGLTKEEVDTIKKDLGIVSLNERIMKKCRA